MPEYILKYQAIKQFTTKKEMDIFIKNTVRDVIYARKHCKYTYEEGKIIRFKPNSVVIKFGGRK